MGRAGPRFAAPMPFPAPPSSGQPSYQEEATAPIANQEPADTLNQAASSSQIFESGAADSMILSMPNQSEQNSEPSLVRFESRVEEQKQPQLDNMLDFLDSQQPSHSNQEESGIEFLNEYLNQAQAQVQEPVQAPGAAERAAVESSQEEQKAPEFD